MRADWASESMTGGVELARRKEEKGEANASPEDRTRDLQARTEDSSHWAGPLLVLDYGSGWLLKCGRAEVALTEF